MSMKVVPMIHVPDVRTTVKWYEMVGFQFLESHEEEGEMTWAALSFGSTGIMLNAPMNDTFYGNREFIIRDPNGFWLPFGQPLRVMEP